MRYSEILLSAALCVSALSAIGCDDDNKESGGGTSAGTESGGDTGGAGVEGGATAAVEAGVMGGMVGGVSPKCRGKVIYLPGSLRDVCLQLMPYI